MSYNQQVLHRSLLSNQEDVSCVRISRSDDDILTYNHKKVKNILISFAIFLHFFTSFYFIHIRGVCLFVYTNTRKGVNELIS